uniref:Endonuclease/exonuclease/phosphatase domain-containing protein n=1 Tax=Xenopus tropicalis TaxID=8364 RepID=A0A803K6Q4_XENTR
MVLDKCIVYSLNTNGLNEPIKRSQILKECAKTGAKIVLLQETHFKESKVPKIPDHTYKTIFTSNNPDKKATGAMILLHKNLPFKLTASRKDTEGRYIMIKGNLSNSKITIASVYSPNTNQITFLSKFTKDLESFAEGITLVGEFAIPNSTKP